MRAVIYARYSTDLQREASIEDQVRVCRQRIEQAGWELVATYSDAAASGASRLRPGYQKLLEDARSGLYDVVVAEALDRLSRDQEDVAALYKHLSFASVQLVTLAEGEISELHVGLKGTMNALFLKDLALKVRRGLEGRVREGRSGGGLCYGYDVKRQLDAKGLPICGDRVINNAEAAVVRRIFQEFAAGHSPRTIALALNRNGIPGPQGRAWGPSTIYGNWRRGTGILNNELYVGRLVWNRQRYVKNPATRRAGSPSPIPRRPGLSRRCRSCGSSMMASGSGSRSARGRAGSLLPRAPRASVRSRPGGPPICSRASSSVGPVAGASPRSARSTTAAPTRATGGPARTASPSAGR
jgi:DNA invertase Pin-like site-specific DNA recombinase